jgi:aryl-alcohol dehydrogenase-like predicted oxidoreductase
MENLAWLRDGLTDTAKNAAVGRLAGVAADLGCTLAQLAIAWCNRNPRVSSVILGASRVEQLHDNLGALAVTPKLTPEVLARIDTCTQALAR